MISTASEVLPALSRSVILFSGVARSSHFRPHGGITFLFCSRFQGEEPTSSPLPVSMLLFALDTFAPHKENLPIRTFVHVTVELFTTNGFTLVPKSVTLSGSLCCHKGSSLHRPMLHAIRSPPLAENKWKTVLRGFAPQRGFSPLHFVQPPFSLMGHKGACLRRPGPKPFKDWIEQKDYSVSGITLLSLHRAGQAC